MLHDRGVCPGVRKGTVTRTLGRLRPRISATLLVTCLVGAGAVALPATAAVAAEGPTVVGDTTFDDGSYVVTLRDPAVASYEGGVSGLVKGGRLAAADVRGQIKSAGRAAPFRRCSVPGEA